MNHLSSLYTRLCVAGLLLSMLAACTKPAERWAGEGTQGHMWSPTKTIVLGGI